MFLLYSLFRKGSAAANLVFFPYSIKDVKIENRTPVMTLGLLVQNTSNQSFNINSIAGQLFANNNLIGNISSFTPIAIAPNSEGIVYIKGRLLLLSIVNDLLNAINSGTWSQDIVLNGTANIDNLQVPVDITYKLKV